MALMLREEGKRQGSSKENSERERLHGASSPSAASKLLSFYAASVAATILLHRLWRAIVECLSVTYFKVSKGYRLVDHLVRIARGTHAHEMLCGVELTAERSQQIHSRMRLALQ